MNTKDTGLKITNIDFSDDTLEQRFETTAAQSACGYGL